MIISLTHTFDLFALNFSIYVHCHTSESDRFFIFIFWKLLYDKGCNSILLKYLSLYIGRYSIIRWIYSFLASTWQSETIRNIDYPMLLYITQLIVVFLLTFFGFSFVFVLVRKNWSWSAIIKFLFESRAFQPLTMFYIVYFLFCLSGYLLSLDAHSSVWSRYFVFPVLSWYIIVPMF